MDKVNEKIINRIQKDFPIGKRPFRVLGEELGIGEDELIERIQELKRDGYIRRLGAVFDTRKLGFSSTLCAMKVPEERLEEVADVVSAYREVTHNYHRAASYNLWFTLVTESQAKIDEILGEISQKTAIKEVRDMPSKRFFKINVDLRL